MPKREIDKDFPVRINISHFRSVHGCITSINYVIPMVSVFINVKEKRWGVNSAQGHSSGVTWVATCLMYLQASSRVGRNLYRQKQ